MFSKQRDFISKNITAKEFSLYLEKQVYFPVNVLFATADGDIGY